MRTVHSLPLADICQRIARVHTAPGQPRAWRARPASTCAAAVRRCGFTPLPPNVRSTVQGSCCSRSMILRPRCRLPQSLHGRPPWPGEATRAARQRQQLASQTPPAPPVLCFDCLHVCLFSRSLNSVRGRAAKNFTSIVQVRTLARAHVARMRLGIRKGGKGAVVLPTIGLYQY